MIAPSKQKHYDVTNWRAPSLARQVLTKNVCVLDGSEEQRAIHQIRGYSGPKSTEVLRVVRIVPASVHEYFI